MEQKFKPILFSSEMIQAILAGRKSQTRRVTVDWDQHKPKFIISSQGMFIDKYPKPSKYMAHFRYLNESTDSVGLVAPIQPDDILWVRESFAPFGAAPFIYKTDQNKYSNVISIKWKPSIHMPKEAARIFLKVTDVRCERLQDISDNDCIAEGIEPMKIIEEQQHYKFYGSKHLTISSSSPNRSFKSLWDFVNGEGSYLKNQWVWVYSFEIIGKPENF